MTQVLVDWDQDFIQLEDVDILGPPCNRIMRVVDLVLPHQLVVEMCAQSCTFLSKAIIQT
jgi:hypothetical protein